VQQLCQQHLLPISAPGIIYPQIAKGNRSNKAFSMSLYQWHTYNKRLALNLGSVPVVVVSGLHY